VRTDHQARATTVIDAQASGIVAARSRRGRSMSTAERVSGLSRAGALVVLAIALPVLDAPITRPPADVAILLVAAFAVVWRTEFETATGVTVPNILVLCPMLVLLPPSLVPAAAAAGALVGDIGRDNPQRRLLGALACTLPVVAPSLVLMWLDPGPSFDDAAAYLAALAAWVAADAGLMLLHQRYALHNPGATVAGVARMYRLELPLALIAFPAAVESDRFRYAFLLPLAVLILARDIAAERRLRVEHAAHLAQAYRGTALLLDEALESTDVLTAVHSRGVLEIVVAVVDELGLTAADRQRAEFAALLHDIGKMRVAPTILNKPDRLTDEEMAAIRRHPEDGAAMLEAIGGTLADVADIVRHHHERIDGAGYPDGLTGEEIPFLARVIGVCDAYAAMVTDRPYRAALSTEVAITELRRCAGTQFDEVVVAALVVVVGRDPALGRQPASTTTVITAPLPRAAGE
jgi:putative nucleotidyltransferase with HDIG domain